MHYLLQREVEVRYSFQGTPFTASSEPLVEIILRRKLRKGKTLSELQEFHSGLGFEVPLCNVCRSAFVPYTYKIERAPFSEEILITGFDTLRKFRYCYGASLKCKSWAKGKGQRNSNSVEFLSAVMACTPQEALAWIKKNNKSPFYLENHASDETYNSSQSHGVDFWVEKLGQEEGRKKNQEIWERANRSRSLQGYVERFGEEHGPLLYAETQKNKDSMSESAIRRAHPELQEDEVRRLFVGRRQSVGLKKENFILKHGSERWEKITSSRAKAAKGRTDARFLLQHGEEAYALLKKRRRMNNRGGSSSKWARGVIGRLIRSVFQEDPEAKLQFGKPEFRLYDANGERWYYYDLYVERGSERYVVELNGVCWHAPPSLSEEERVSWRKLGSRASWGETRTFDLRKESLVVQNHIKLLVVWDNMRLDEIEQAVRRFVYG